MNFYKGASEKIRGEGKLDGRDHRANVRKRVRGRRRIKRDRKREGKLMVEVSGYGSRSGGRSNCEEN